MKKTLLILSLNAAANAGTTPRAQVHREATFADVREAQIADICSFFQVPPLLLVEPGHVMSRAKWEQLQRVQQK